MKSNEMVDKIEALQELVKKYSPLIRDDNDFYSPDAFNLREKIQNLYYEIEPYLDEAIGKPVVEVYQQRMPAFDTAFSEMNPTASFYAIKSVPQLLRKAVAHYRRKPDEKTVESTKIDYTGETGLYIKEEIIDLISKKENGFDYSKLKVLIDELNKSHLNHDVYSSLSLIRTIQNHIPPLFGFNTFEEVASNYSWGTTDKKYVQILLESRNISDDTLHRRISNKKDLADMGDIPAKICLNTLLQEALVNGLTFNQYIDAKKMKSKVQKTNKKQTDDKRPLLIATLGSSSRGNGTYQAHVSIKNYGKQVAFIKSAEFGDVIVKKNNLAIDEKESTELLFQLHNSNLRNNDLKNPKFVISYQDIAGNSYTTAHELNTELGDNKLIIVRSFGEAKY